MYTKLNLVVNEKETINAYMQIAGNGTDLTITYFDEHGAIIVTDKLSHFQKLEISSKNSRMPFSSRMANVLQVPL